MRLALVIAALGTLLIYGSLDGRLGGLRFIVGILSLYALVVLAMLSLDAA